VKRFKPHAVVGTGGYASGPIMLAATRKQNSCPHPGTKSYAGLTNKQLASKVQRVCVAYYGMEKYFPKDKLMFTATRCARIFSTRDQNAIGPWLILVSMPTKNVVDFRRKPWLANDHDSILIGIDKLIDSHIQVIWQTGKIYFEKIKEQSKTKDLRKIRIHDFLNQMDMAYASADVVISSLVPWPSQSCAWQNALASWCRHPMWLKIIRQKMPWPLWISMQVCW